MLSQSPISGAVISGYSSLNDINPPVSVGVLSSSNVGMSSFTLSWQAATDETAVAGYEVSYDNGSTYSDVGNVLSYTKIGLTQTTTYSTRVRAYDAAGNKATPLALSVTTTAVPPMPMLTQTVRTLGAISPTSLMLGSTATAFVYSQNKGQSIILYNKSGSSVVVNIAGSTAPVITIPNTGGITVNLAAGWNITVPTGFTRIELDRSSALLVGTTTLTANVENAVTASLVA
jgi:hypothetical protein